MFLTSLDFKMGKKMKFADNLRKLPNVPHTHSTPEREAQYLLGYCIVSNF